MPSVEKLVVDGDSVVTVGVEMLFPTVTLFTLEGETLALTVPEIVPLPPLIPPDVVDDPPPPPLPPPLLPPPVTIVKLLFEDKVPVTSSA